MSGIRCSATSRRTSSAKCNFTSERGTCPLRNPGSRACFCTRPYARSHSLCTTSAGASTARRRLHASSSSTATFTNAPRTPPSSKLRNGARGGSRTPKGFYTHRILSPERLPVSPLSRDRREFARQEHTDHGPGPQGSARFVETTWKQASVLAPALNRDADKTGGGFFRDESPDVRRLGVGPHARGCRRAGGARRTRDT